MLTDFRYALRQLRKAPGFAFVVVLTLALGIGANTAIFSFVRGILLRPLPYEDPEQLVLFKKTAGDFSDPMGVELGFLAADFSDLEPQTRTLQSMATYTVDSATLTGREGAELTVGSVVSRNFFSVLGTPAQLGRIFTAADAGAGRLAVISHPFWQARFGGDPTIIGQTLRLNNVLFTVVGVAPADFEFPRESQYWVTPAREVPENQIGQVMMDFSGRGNYLRSVIGRLQPGVTLPQAEAELRALVELLPNPNLVQRAVHLVTMRDQSVGNVRPALATLLACVGMVLLIACLNVANLTLARATGRQREIGIRLALGAARWRIARQLLAESVLLAVLAGVAGVLISWWGLDLLVRLAPAEIPRLASVQLDSAVLIFAVAISLLTGLLSGVAPILGTARTDLVSITKSGGRSGSESAAPRRLRALLVTGEVAISLILLVAAGLLVRSMARMQAFAWGFNPAHVVSARVAFIDERYQDEKLRYDFYRKFADRMSREPGFQSVGTSLDRIGQSWIHLQFSAEGHHYRTPGERPQANYHVVDPGYLSTVDIPLIEGRTLTINDHAQAPLVAVVDASLAQRYYPEGRAVGRRLLVPTPNGDTWAEIVGVVGVVKTDGPERLPVPDIYLSFFQVPSNNFFAHVRTPLDVATVGATIRRVVADIDPNVPVSDLASMTQVIAKPAAARRFPLGLLGAFAALAMLLAAVGIYAVTGYGVTQRTREIGVRMALGAPPRAVLALMLGQSFRPIACGLGLGLVGGSLTALGMRRMLFEVPPLDLQTFTLVPLLLGLVALLACWLPARRATKVDPLIALRTE